MLLSRFCNKVNTYLCVNLYIALHLRAKGKIEICNCLSKMFLVKSVPASQAWGYMMFLSELSMYCRCMVKTKARYWNIVWFIIKKCLHRPFSFFNLFQGVSHLLRLESGKQPRDEAQRPCLMHVLIYDLQVDYSSKQKRAKAINTLKGTPHYSTVSEEELTAKLNSIRLNH